MDIDCSFDNNPSKEDKIVTDYNSVRHLDTPIDEPKESEWIFYIKEEPQSLDSYIKSIQPNNKSRVLLRLDKDYLIYSSEHIIKWLNEIYNTQIVVSDTIDINATPSTISNLISQCGWKGLLFAPIAYLGISYMRKRNLSQIGHVQYRGNFIMVQATIDIKDTPLTKCIVLTNKDIYDDGTSFVFGLSEMNGDISLVSTYYFPQEDIRSKLRLLKIITHEFGHTLGIEHCTSHKCIFGGVMSLNQLDSHPLLPCLEDCAKIAHACGKTLRQQLQCFINACNKLNLAQDIPNEYNHIYGAIELLPE